MNTIKKIINGILKRFNLRIISYSRYCILVERGEVLNKLDNIDNNTVDLMNKNNVISDYIDYIKNKIDDESTNILEMIKLLNENKEYQEEKNRNDEENNIIIRTFLNDNVEKMEYLKEIGNSLTSNTENIKSILNDDLNNVEFLKEQSSNLMNNTEQIKSSLNDNLVNMEYLKEIGNNLINNTENMKSLLNDDLSNMEFLKEQSGNLMNNTEQIKSSLNDNADNIEYLKERNNELINNNSSVIEIANNSISKLDENRNHIISSMEKMDNLSRKLMYTRWNLIDTIHSIGKEEKLDKCPICGAEIKGDEKVYETECIFNGGRLRRIQCSNCDLIFGDEKIYFMSDKELSNEYLWHYSIFHEGDSHTKEVKAFLDLNPKKDGIYLNFGAGSWSRSTETIREMGYNIYAYEPYAPENNNPYYITDKNQLGNIKFDGIFSHDLLEHLKYPIDELKFMASILKDDGIMNHVTGCYEYMYEYTRFHLFFFLGKSKYILAEKSGLSLDAYNIDNELKYYSCIYRKK